MLVFCIVALHPKSTAKVMAGVTCMLFIYFVYLVSADPDIGDIDGK